MGSNNLEKIKALAEEIARKQVEENTCKAEITSCLQTVREMLLKPRINKTAIVAHLDSLLKSIK